VQKLTFKNKFFLHPEFKDRVNAIGRDVSLPKTPSQYSITTDHSVNSNGKISICDKITAIPLNPKLEYEYFKKNKIFAYDESSAKYNTLEGSGILTCHSLVYIDDFDYLATTCLSFGFYTRSELLLDKNKEMKDVRNQNTKEMQKMGNFDQIDAAYKADYAIERTEFIVSNVVENSVVFIDGPLIGNQMTSYNLKMIDKFKQKLVISIFIVKNSNSNLLTDNLDILRGKYNSDLHWANQFLKPGERTNFFRYTDAVNPENTKVFCYIKPMPLECSPQRIEFHPYLYSQNKEFVEKLMNIIYYLYLVNGNPKNCQIRPITVAEMYAREVKKMYNINKFLDESDLKPTMNQARGFG